MRKSALGYLILFLIATPMFCGQTRAQEGFFDVIKYAVKGEGPGKSIDARMYGALGTMAWDDKNQNGELEGDELLLDTLKIYDRHGNLALESPAGLNGDQLEAWATENAKAILAAIFPGGLSSNAGPSDDGLMAAQSLSNQMTKAKPAKSASKGQDFLINSQFKGVLEYLSLKVNDHDGKAGSILFGYQHEFSSGLQLNVNLPYRYTSISDEINSKSHFAGLDFSGKYPLMTWDSAHWDIGMDIFGSAYYLSSDAINHAGNLKYGAGFFTALTKDFSLASLCIGADYKVAKTTVPSSWVDSNNEFIDSAVEYVNDLDMVKTFSQGLNLGVPLFNEAAAVNLEVIHSIFYSNDIEDDRDAQTTVGLTLDYCPTDTFELSLGGRKTFELEDIDLTGVYFGAVYRY